MTTPKLLILSSCCLSIGLACCSGTADARAAAAPPTSADTSATPQPAEAPRYDSDTDLGRVRSSTFTTPESDGRPGVYYFELGARAAKHHDYSHAIAMYKVAASWAYKPAQ